MAKNITFFHFHSDSFARTLAFRPGFSIPSTDSASPSSGYSGCYPDSLCCVSVASAFSCGANPPRSVASGCDAISAASCPFENCDTCNCPYSDKYDSQPPLAWNRYRYSRCPAVHRCHIHRLRLTLYPNRNCIQSDLNRSKCLFLFRKCNFRRICPSFR